MVPDSAGSSAYSQPAPVPSVVYHQVMRPPTNGLAVAALVLGIVAIALGVWIVIPIIGLVFAFLSFAPAVLALILGLVGLQQARRIGVGRGLAITGVSLGAATLTIGVLTTGFWIIALVGSAASSSAGS
jgi:hypothetical protein